MFSDTFEAERIQNGSKNQKTYFVNVSWNTIMHPSQGLSFIFSFKKSNSPQAKGQHIKVG
jgi:hypothetical protein